MTTLPLAFRRHSRLRNIVVLASTTILLIAQFAWAAASKSSTPVAGLYHYAHYRLINTTDGTGGLTSLPAATWTTIDVATPAGLDPSTTVAAELNFNVLNPTGDGYLRAVANDATPTNVSIVNFAVGDHTSNSAVVALSSDGKIKVWSSATTGIAIDLQGYYSTVGSGGNGFVPVDEQQIGSSAQGTGGFAAGALSSASGPASIQVAGLADVPTSASSVMLEIDAASTNATDGDLVVWASGAAEPKLAALAFTGNEKTAWSRPVGLGSNGQVSFDVKQGSANLTVSVLGYFTAAGGDTYGAFVPFQSRIVNTSNETPTTLAANASRDIQITGVNGIPDLADDSISAVAANIYANPTSNVSGNVSAYSGDDSSGSPAVYFNATAGSQSLAIVPVGTWGDIQVTNNSSSPIQLIVDVEGWFEGKPGDDGTAPAAGGGDIQIGQAPAYSSTSAQDRTFTGTVTNAAGAVQANIPVTLYDETGTQYAGAVDTAPISGAVVATATTDSSGAWTVTLPSTLPSNLQAEADANSGVINVVVMADAHVSGQPEISLTAAVGMPLGVGISSSAAAAGADDISSQVDASNDNTRPVMALNVAGTQDLAPPTDDGLGQDPPATSTAAGVTPVVDDPGSETTWNTVANEAAVPASANTVNGVNYSNAVAVPELAADGRCSIWYVVDSKDTWKYTPVGEAHAYWDATASFYYETSLATSVTMGVAVGDGDFTVSGSTTLGSKLTHRVGATGAGPYIHRRFLLPITYEWQKWRSNCTNASGSKSWPKFMRTITPTTYAGAQAHNAWIWGGKVGGDGKKAFENSNPKYEDTLPSTGFWATASAHSYSYKLGVSVFGWATVAAETVYDSSHLQQITAGKQTKAVHLIRANNCNPYANGCNPKALYSW